MNSKTIYLVLLLAIALCLVTGERSGVGDWDPCNPNPCGINTVCRAGNCKCLPNCIGNPFVGCRPECVQNADCSRHKMCRRNKCIDPCLGACGLNAQCDVVDHLPVCSCPPGYVGNPFVDCRFEDPKPRDPCNPSPCGPNSYCKHENPTTFCWCREGFFGSAPNCYQPCDENFRCPTVLACVNNRCTDPCSGYNCPSNERCVVIDHSPACKYN